MDKAVDNDSLAKSKEWKRPEEGGELDPEIDNRLIAGDRKGEDGKLEVHSLSGKERNHLFLNGNSGNDFADVSALSGTDSASDSRCFGLLDYDHDGWQDIALVNANQPLMQLFHNDIGQLRGGTGGIIAVRFVGGNHSAQKSEMSNRDGYGAVVEVVLSGGGKIKREHRCGDGYAAQNSDTMLIGIGDRDKVESLNVRWPSGRIFSADGIPEGTLVTAYENREEGAFRQKPYRDLSERLADVRTKEEVFPIARVSQNSEVQIYTTTATWCAACVSHLPALERLQQDGIALFGVPIDPDDDEKKLADYVEAKKPPYEMLKDLGVKEKKLVSDFIARQMQVDNPAFPSTVITDARGKVLKVMQGVPTLSEVRKWRSSASD